MWFPLAVRGASRGAAMRGARSGALVVVLLGLLIGPTGAQGKLEARYTASVAGIVVGRGSWSIEIGQNQYTAAAGGRVVGLLKILSNGEGTAAAVYWFCPISIAQEPRPTTMPATEAV